MLLPGATVDETRQILTRLRANGLGQRPDGSLLTASIGVAERLQDQAENSQVLIQLADQRMYRAKAGGKDGMVFHE